PIPAQPQPNPALPPNRVPSFLRRVPRVVVRVLAWVWRAIDSVRRVAINLLFIAIVTLILVILFSDSAPTIHDETAVVVRPRGTLVEELAGDPASRFQDMLTGQQAEETLLRDVIDTIDAARKDDRVKVLVLDLSRLKGSGMSKLQDLRAPLQAFRETGRPIIATADSYSQAAYYLAAHADEVYLHDLGEVEMVGLSRFRTYFRDALDKLEIEWHIFRVGKFKSAVEPYLLNGMSEQARQANLEWMGDLWQAYLDDVSLARGVSTAELRDYAEHFDHHLQAARGDTAVAALEAGLVDHIGGRDQVRTRLIELVGEDEKTHSFHQIAGTKFLSHVRETELPEDTDQPEVAVIVARGTIQNGSHPPGTIGGDSTAALIRKARTDDNVKALVLRVDSGGGSAFASEVIRREFELAREQGKPVVVSMGSVAASGGYWISCASDEIWASPTTITGSIGIFGMFPTVHKPLAKLGIHVDGVAQTPRAGLDIARPLPKEVAEGQQIAIENGYQRFLQTVGTSRDMTPQEVDKVAQGRVWSGLDAKEHGLVDNLGGLNDAIASAAARANLEVDAYRTTYVEREASFGQKLMKDLFSATATWIVDEEAANLPIPTGPYSQVLRMISEQAEILQSFNDPRGIYAYELIDLD
ncbi:MAG: signal peptide peptidase SppA, partial [Nannocystaceae bacterium]